MFLRLAWAYGLLKTLPWSMFGIFMSPMNFAPPVTMSTASFRGVDFPMNLYRSDISIASFSDGCHHCIENLIVADASTVVPRKGLLDLLLCRGGILIEECLGAHEDPRSAESALKRRMVDKCLLKRIQFPGI